MPKRELALERRCTKESMIEIIKAMNCAERVNKKTLLTLSLCKKKKVPAKEQLKAKPYLPKTNP